MLANERVRKDSFRVDMRRERPVIIGRSRRSEEHKVRRWKCSPMHKRWQNEEKGSQHDNEVCMASASCLPAFDFRFPLLSLPELVSLSSRPISSCLPYLSKGNKPGK